MSNCCPESYFAAEGPSCFHLLQIESQAVLAAGTVVPPARVIPSGELWAGNPAKFVRKLTYDEVSTEAGQSEK